MILKRKTTIKWECHISFKHPYLIWMTRDVMDLLATWNGSIWRRSPRNGMVKWVLDLPCVAAGL